MFGSVLVQRVAILVLWILVYLGMHYASYLWYPTVAWTYQHWSPSIWEAFLFVGLTWTFYIPNFWGKWSAPFIALVPGLTLYAIYDVYLCWFQRIPAWSDLHNLPSLFALSPWFSVGFMSLVLLSIGMMVRALRRWALPIILRSFLMRNLPWILLIGLFQIPWVGSRYLQILPVVEWSPFVSTVANGRMIHAIEASLRENKTMRVLKSIPSEWAEECQSQVYAGRLLSRPNVYLIVMESWLDPRRLTQIQWSRDPLAEELKPFLGPNQSFSTLISPVYGGATAQAEFEVLSGSPALGLAKSIEFNVMNGKTAPTFVQRFREQGYQTSAILATTSVFYNGSKAYRSMGFEQIDFLQERRPELVKSDFSFIFDGDLFEEFLKQPLGNSNRPKLNYLLSVYGHTPFDFDTTRFAKMITGTNAPPELERIANQFYYRTQALGRFLNELHRRDSNALVFITSDHLPNVLSKDVIYQGTKYENIALLVHRGKFVPLPKQPYFQATRKLWSLAGGEVGQASRDSITCYLSLLRVGSGL